MLYVVVWDRCRYLLLFFPLFSKGEEGSIVDPSNEREGEREDEEK